jgi:uroporphyrin-III C-methyltransferase / precorrin-2 dehydrogenase / sirohydrochlorin ferrochelatase
MVALARGGKRVVRLKGGDPLIFGRAGEEIAACRAAEIPIEIVPGITAAQGAAARLEAPLTHRREARRLQYITASSEEGAVPDDVNWASIADPSTTSAVYMPRKGLREFCSRGIAAGMDPATAAVAVICATRASEKIVRGNVADIADRLAQAESSGPVLVLIGSTLCQGEPGGDVAAIRNSA